MRVPSVKIFSFYITLSYLAIETFRSSDKQIYTALVKKTKNKKCSRCAHITDVWKVQLLLCSFLTSKQNGRSRQLHATAACLLKKPLVVTTKQESGWAPGPVWELWWREQPLASVGNQTTISRSSNQQWQYRLRHATPQHSDNCVLNRALHDFYSSYNYRVHLSVAVPSFVTKMDYLEKGHFLSLDIII